MTASIRSTTFADARLDGDGRPPSSIAHCGSTLLTLVLVVLAIAPDAWTAETAQRSRLNVVLLLVDDLGWTDVGCFGSPLHQTPHVDQLARSGVRFTNAYAPACSCSPSRAGIMTGKYPGRLGMTAIVEKHRGDLAPDDAPLLPATTRPFLPGEEQTIAEVLQAAGYATCLVGKWHLGDGSHDPRQHGFDVAIAPPHAGAPKSYFWPQWDGRPRLTGRFDGEYLTDRLAEEACQFLEQAIKRDRSNFSDSGASGVDAKGTAPFFLCLSFHSVHVPIEAKPEKVATYEALLQETSGDPPQHHNPHYAAMVESMDEAVGRVLNTLEQHQLEDDTLVIFFSDNGGLVHRSHLGDHTPATSNQPLCSGKGFLYEGGIRVPLIIRWPGVADAGSVCHRPVHGCDLFPTICHAAGLASDGWEASDALDGQSLVPLLRNPALVIPERTLYWHYPHFSTMGGRPSGAIRQGRWKLLEHFESAQLELYDLEQDVGETHDLSREHPERTRQLHQSLVDWRARMHALVPSRPNPNYRRPEEGRNSEASRAPAVWWPFDVRLGTQNQVAESLGRQRLAITSAVEIPRAAGVHGTGLRLAGQHQLQTPLGPILTDFKEISISAWVQPNAFDRYNEILRQECPERVLFSFQEHGTILSLGLNIDGYLECDAPVSRDRLLDGCWHHCAATYDGQWMRVYLDGQRIGELARRGEWTIRDDVSAYVGSSSGKGEFFQGGLDELQVDDKAWSQADILDRYENGMAAILRKAGVVQETLRQILEPQPTFAETLARAGRTFAGTGERSAPELAGLFNARVRSLFPTETGEFERLTNRTPFETISAADGEFFGAAGSQLTRLLLEYQPLTDAQRRQQTPAERARSQEARRLADEFQRLVQNQPSPPELEKQIQLIFQLGRHVQFRPVEHEAVAPFVPPLTPPLHKLTAEETQAAMESDWLHQCDGQPSRERIQQEVEWTRGIAAKIAEQTAREIDFAEELARLDNIAQQTTALVSKEELRTAYFRVRELKRAIMLRNPVIDFSQVLLVDMPFPQGREWRHETRHRLGYMAVPGGRLLVLDGLSPGGTLRQLMPQSPLHGSFWRPDLSFDARRVLCCFKPHNEKSFHLYEIGIDGSGLRQLTKGPYDDLDPIYLPDGEHILFSTTRGHTYVRCMPPTNAFVLARCRITGDQIYLVSRNNEPDYLPSVMDDGRVLYTRWEYTDKPLWRAQGLWTMNPDGTQVNTLWGNQSVWPDLLKDARSIPNSRRILFTGSAHHDWFAGAVGIIDPIAGFNFPDGLTKVTAELPWPESGNGPADPVESPTYHASGKYTAYYSPYPLSEREFLVSAERNGKFVLYLMDVDGNRELIHEGTHQILHAIPVRPRKPPAAIQDRVAWPTREQRQTPEDGLLYSRNVYHGAPAALHGRARYLRVWNIQPKTYTYWYKRPYLSTGPVVSAVQSEGVKQLLGTVPIESDGSVAFHTPSGMALHFQLLDDQYRALQTMRSFTGVMPGERRGCVGCHESHSRTPDGGAAGIALSHRPRTIIPPPWEDTTVSFARYVRPMLDRYCVECHPGSGQSDNELDLTFRPGQLGFDECYWTLTGHPSWGQPYQAPENPPLGWAAAGMLMVEAYGKLDPAGYRTPEPMTALSYRSRLIEIASNNGHYGVQVDPMARRRLIAWVDAMCPYRGESEVREIEDPQFPGVDWLAIRPRIRSAPHVIRPGPVDGTATANSENR